VPIGSKVGFKPAKEYRPVSKKPNANISGNKKKGLEPTKEVSYSNPFDMLNSVENDKQLGNNGGTSNFASNEANSSGSSFYNVETSSTSNTSIVDKIGKLKKLIVDGKVTLVDDDGKPLKKVNYLGDHDSEHEVESVDNDMARSMASKGVVLALKVCWNNEGILMRMVTMMKTHTIMICMKNLLILYLEYGVLSSSGYGVLILFPSWSLVKSRHGYAIFSLMDTAYVTGSESMWMSGRLVPGGSVGPLTQVSLLWARMGPVEPTMHRDSRIAESRRGPTYGDELLEFELAVIVMRSEKNIFMMHEPTNLIILLEKPFKSIVNYIFIINARVEARKNGDNQLNFPE
ncbi:hypothetical protein Tco_0558280, partial [Tanacetum coccineum]